MKFTNESNLHEPKLILEASKGDLNAFNQLVLKYQGLIFNHAYVLLGDCQSAEDATQKSFIKAFQKMSGFRGRFFRAWLLRIVTNTCYDEIRWIKRHPTIPLIPEDDDGEGIESPVWLIDSTNPIENMMEQGELSLVLYRMLGQLPEIYRSPISLIDLHELSYAEAAEVLEIPIGTLKSRLSRARFQMKENLQKNFDIPVAIHMNADSYYVGESSYIFH